MSFLPALSPCSSSLDSSPPRSRDRRTHFLQSGICESGSASCYCDVLVEDVGMVALGAPVGSPGLRLSVVMGVVIKLLRWPVGIGQLVVGVLEGFAVSTCDGTDGGVQPGAGRGGGGVGA